MLFRSTEACGNAVRHAYRDEDGTVRLELVLRPDRLDMIVADQGSGISVPQIDELVHAEPLDQPVDGGMGMAIIRAIVDELDVREGGGGRGTVVHMTKYLAAAPAA